MRIKKLLNYKYWFAITLVSSLLTGIALNFLPIEGSNAMVEEKNIIMAEFKLTWLEPSDVLHHHPVILADVERCVENALGRPIEPTDKWWEITNALPIYAASPAKNANLLENQLRSRATTEEWMSLTDSTSGYLQVSLGETSAGNGFKVEFYASAASDVTPGVIEGVASRLLSDIQAGIVESRAKDLYAINNYVRSFGCDFKKEIGDWYAENANRPLMDVHFLESSLRETAEQDFFSSPVGRVLMFFFVFTSLSVGLFIGAFAISNRVH